MPYHIVLTIEPRAGAAGTTRVTWYAAPAGSASLGAAQGTFDTANTLNQLNDALAYLGRSQYATDSTANARYDDFRIWDGALTLMERETNHLAGPDATPDEDTDNDSLPDAWEMRWFRNLNQSADGDPDDDDYLNDAELDSQSDPTLAASTPLDRDANGLTDTWEIEYFADLTHNGGSDPDNDGFGNLQEHEAATNPAAASSRPTGTAVR